MDWHFYHQKIQLIFHNFTVYSIDSYSQAQNFPRIIVYHYTVAKLISMKFE